jgi:hypothetical protein
MSDEKHILAARVGSLYPDLSSVFKVDYGLVKEGSSYSIFS